MHSPPCHRFAHIDLASHEKFASCAVVRTFFALLALLSSLLPLSLAAQGGNSHGEAWEQAREGRERIASGDFDGAIEKFSHAHKLQPDIAEFQIGLANAWFFKQDYKQSMGYCRPLMSGRKARPDAFQVYGNCLDAMGKPYEALETYRKGLKLFPDAGVLYLEMGTVEAGRDRNLEALGYFEQGIRVQPTLSSNYYFAAQTLFGLGDYAWAAHYAELFINLERNGDRVREMSRLLMSAYEKARIFDFETAYHWQFLQPTDPGMQATPHHAAMDEGHGAALMDTARVLTIHRLAETRRFVGHWLPTKLPDSPARALFEWHQTLVRQGIFEAYNYWLLYDAREKEFVDWLATHQRAYADFEAWFLLNTFHRHVKRPISRPTAVEEKK